MDCLSLWKKKRQWKQLSVKASAFQAEASASSNKFRTALVYSDRFNPVQQLSNSNTAALDAATILNNITTVCKSFLCCKFTKVISKEVHEAEVLGNNVAL